MIRDYLPITQTTECKEKILNALKNAKSQSEWNTICDDVKAYMRLIVKGENWFNDDYPNWWFEEVILKIYPSFYDPQN